MATGRQFKAQLGAWANQTQEKLDALVRQSAQELAARVVKATPVDTGFLRGSWQPSIGNGPAGAGPGDVSLVAAQIKAGQQFYLLNNAEYALHVEYGTSKMAGRHYVGNNVAAWPLIVDQVAATLKLKP